MSVCVKTQVQLFNECLDCLEALGVNKELGDVVLLTALEHSTLDRWDASLLLKRIKTITRDGSIWERSTILSQVESVFSNYDSVQFCFMPDGLESFVDFSVVRQLFGTVWDLGDSVLERDILSKIDDCFSESISGDVLGIASWLVLLFCPAFLESTNVAVLMNGLRVMEEFDWQHRTILKRVMTAFKEEDMIHLLKILHTALDSFLDDGVIDPTECSLVLDLTSLVYEANQVSHVVSNRAFYNTGFNDSGCIHGSEHERFMEFCFLNYSFLFNSQNKAAILEEEFDEIRSNGEEWDNSKSPLLLTVDRHNLLEDAIEIVLVAKANGTLRNSICVTFIGEAGIDDGGLSKEFFRIAFQQLFSPEYGMFIYDNESNLMWFRSSDLDLSEEFNFTGILLGLALFNGFVVNIQLPLVFYKKLLGQELTAEDLKDVHPDVYRNLKQLLDMESGVESLGLYFAVDEDAGLGQREEVLLKPNGDEIPVTDENKHEYAKLYAHHLLEARVKSEFEPLRSGFLEVCQTRSLNLVQHFELEEILCGMKTTDIADLKAHTNYIGYDRADPIIQWLWEILHCCSEDQRRKFLAFVTGSDRAPIGGFGALDPLLTIRKVARDSQSLPTSATCFNGLSLPNYETKQLLEERLDVALRHTEGFGCE